MTNYERIINMTEEEMANFLERVKNMQIDMCVDCIAFKGFDIDCNSENGCFSCWLASESEE